MRDIVHLFSSRAELVESGETTDSLRKDQEEEASIVERDKTNEEGGGLFRGCFPKPRRTAFYDPGDGVQRCPGCNWELEGGYCGHCDRDYDMSDGLSGLSASDGYDSDELDSPGSLGDLDERSSQNSDISLDEDGNSVHAHENGINGDYTIRPPPHLGPRDRRRRRGQHAVPRLAQWSPGPLIPRHHDDGESSPIVFGGGPPEYSPATPFRGDDFQRNDYVPASPFRGDEGQASDDVESGSEESGPTATATDDDSDLSGFIVNGEEDENLDEQSGIGEGEDYGSTPTPTQSGIISDDEDAEERPIMRSTPTQTQSVHISDDEDEDELPLGSSSSRAARGHQNHGRPLIEISSDEEENHHDHEGRDEAYGIRNTNSEGDSDGSDTVTSVAIGSSQSSRTGGSSPSEHSEIHTPSEPQRSDRHNRKRRRIEEDDDDDDDDEDDSAVPFSSDSSPVSSSSSASPVGVRRHRNRRGRSSAERLARIASSHAANQSRRRVHWPSELPAGPSSRHSSSSSGSNGTSRHGQTSYHNYAGYEEELV